MSTADTTLEDLQTLLAKYRAAELAAASGKSYTIDGIQLERQDLAFIRHAITNIRREIMSLEQAALGGTQGQRMPRWS